MNNNKIKVLLISDQKNKFELILENENNNSLNLYAYSIDSIFSQQYEKTSFTLDDMKLNKYFESFDNIKEIYNELSNKLKDSIIFENTNELIISIPLNSNIIKEILFKLNEEIKTNEESISDLYKINKTLFKKINLLESKIENINKELNECKNKNKQLELKNNEIMDNLNILKYYKIGKENKYLFQTLLYDEELKKSAIINENEIKMINNWINPNLYINYELLYKATIDGDTISKFHEKCDNKGNTICFIKLQDNFRLGGYTSKSWNYKINAFINDDNTFIFDLNIKKKYLPKNKKCIYSSKNGFSFGNFNIGVKENNFLNKKLITSFDNNYYDDLEGFKKKNKFKIILIGDSCVGKSSIIQIFIDKRNTINDALTLYTGSKKITLSNKYEINLFITDTHGQERYKSMNLLMSKSQDAIIMVYDITKYNSFENIKILYKNIKNFVKQDMVYGIIGNKCDLLKKEVNDEEARNFAKEINACFSLVSNISYSEIEKFFNDLCLNFKLNNNITEIEVYKVNLIK